MGLRQAHKNQQDGSGKHQPSRKAAVAVSAAVVAAAMVPAVSLAYTHPGTPSLARTLGAVAKSYHYCGSNAPSHHVSHVLVTNVGQARQHPGVRIDKWATARFSASGYDDCTVIFDHLVSTYRGRIVGRWVLKTEGSSPCDPAQHAVPRNVCRALGM